MIESVEVATFGTHSTGLCRPETTLESAMNPLRLTAGNALNIARELMCLVDDWAGGRRDHTWSDPARRLFGETIALESPAAQALKHAVVTRFAIDAAQVPAAAFDTVGSLMQHVFVSLS